MTPELASRLIRWLALAALVLLIAFGYVLTAEAAQRSKKALDEFKKEHPCPATGKSRGACPGYVIDHIKPLCAGGPDHPSNMQWQTISDGKKKDRLERKMCRAEKI